MKTEISDEVYLVSAAPVTHVFWTGRYNTGNVVDYFLATPIIGKPLIGKKRTVWSWYDYIKYDYMSDKEIEL